MTEPIFGADTTVPVAAQGPALWTLALNYVTGPVKVRIRVPAGQTWQSANTPHGASGSLAGAPDALVPSAPVGALVAKIGGGDAECPPFAAPGTPAAAPAGASKMFAVGSFCIVDVKQGEGGPLFLAMNDKVAGFANHSGNLNVQVAIAVG